MLLFYCTFEDSFEELLTRGLTAEGEPFRLFRSLKKARKACRGLGRHGPGRVLVLDGDKLKLDEDGRSTHRIKRKAVLNARPYRRPRKVTAAGGLVLRRPDPDAPPELLLIFRRGAWDLPKGKQDRGESNRETAAREVCEEIGIDAVTLTAKAGRTVHGYTWKKKNAYAVKTTHWYAMTTEATQFEPEEAEDIEAVEWAPWPEAVERLGYKSLRRFLRGLDPEALGV